MYGSGWVWLIDREGNLEVVSTHDHYSPEATAESVTTIICLDMWEHAFWNDFGTQREVGDVSTASSSTHHPAALRRTLLAQHQLGSCR